MNPYLNARNHPKVKITILLPAPIEIDCYIDTGFSGGLSLPLKLRGKFKDKPIAIQEYLLADGSKVKNEVYLCKVKYKTTEKRLSLIFTKSHDALLGIEFLQGLELVLDLKRHIISLD